MAQGSGVPIEHLAVLNARNDLAALQTPLAERRSESSSVFFSNRATNSQTPILAHSWSSLGSPHNTELLVCIKIRYQASEEKPDIIMVTEAGRISGCGMNARGLAATGNWLLSTDDTRASAPEYFPMTCFERFVLEYSSVDGLREVPEDTTRHASRHIIVVNKDGRSTSLEVGPEHVFFHGGKFGSWANVHGNHFQSFDAFYCRHDMRDRYMGNYSQARLSRFNELLEANEAGVSRQQIMDMFSDHQGSPESICEHGDGVVGSTTIAFVMFDTERRIISVGRGPPCQAAMSHFTFGSETNADKDEEMEHAEAGDVGSEMGHKDMEEEMSSDMADGNAVNLPLNNSPVSEAACGPSPTLTPVKKSNIGAADTQGATTMDMDWNTVPPTPVSVLPPLSSRDPTVSPTKDRLTPSGRPESETPAGDRRSSKRKTPPTSPVSEGSSPNTVAYSASGKNLEKPENAHPKKRVRFWDPVRDAIREYYV
jgi:isopenicillin-N N-acyltransferase-like protein